MSCAIIFGALNIGKSIAEYIGLIDSVNADVKKLLHQSFYSAIQNLDCAKSAS